MKKLSLIKITLIIIALTTIFIYQDFANEYKIFNLPATIPVPEWVKKADWNNPNIFIIDSLIKAYPKSEKTFEEPYLTAYLRWKNRNINSIKSNGNVEINSDYNKQILLNAINNQNSDIKSKNQVQATKALWTPLGPTETYWQANNGKACEQVNVYQIGISPSKPSVLYCASETGIIFKSTNKGANWFSVSDALPPLGVNSIAVHPNNENIVYIYVSGYGLLLTTDGGKKWDLLKSYKGEGGEKIEFNIEIDRIMITGSRSIYYSDDGGANWTESTGSAINGYYYDLVYNFDDKNYLLALAGTNKNELLIMKSTDGGKSFTQVNTGLPPIENSGSRFGISKANGNYIYIVALGNTTGPKIIKSVDAGATWKVVASSTNTTLTGDGGTTGLNMSNGQGYYDMDIMVDPNNANNVIVGTTSTYKSTDGGVNFSPLGGYAGGIFGIHVDLQCARVMGNDSYLTTDGGVNRSTDFFTKLENWEIINNGLTGADYWGYGQGWDEDIIVGGRYHNGDAAIFDKYGDGKSLGLGGGESATGHVFHGHERTIGFNDIGTYKIPESLSKNIIGAEMNNTLWPQDDYYGQFSSELVFDPRYSNTFFLGRDSTLWKSTNNGSSYSALKVFTNGNTVWRIEIARSNPDFIYVCTRNGLYKTSDAGKNWKLLTLPVAYNFYNSDIAVNPENENEIYLCMSNNPATDKVIYSSNGGDNWKNITGTILKGSPVSYLQYQGGTNGGIYAITSLNSTAKVFYRDNSMNDWVDFSNGLPLNFYPRMGGQIFYRDSKLRLTGSRGVWESPLYSSGSPVAQPMVDKSIIACDKDTVNFYCYSMIDYKGAKWHWSFPGASYVSDSTSRKPKVLYPGIGKYSVTLTITDSAGKSNSKTISDMIQFLSNNCTADSVPGKCLAMDGSEKTINLGKVNINSNNFTMSCWFKPNNVEGSFSQLLSHYGCPGSPGYGIGLGFTFSGYTPNLMLCYTDDQVNYGNYSGLVCDSNKWNHIALTYTADGVYIYLNGIGVKVNGNKMPALDLSQSPFYVNADIHYQGSRLKGQIDEIKFYNYALTQEEIREKMHLIPDNPNQEKGLVKYFQFNNFDNISQTLYDVITGHRADVANSNVASSTAPVGIGSSFRINSINSAGKFEFKDANIDLFLPETGIYPDGEMVAFYLKTRPDQLPDKNRVLPGHYIINNYGKNATIAKPDSIIFKNLAIDSKYYNPGNFSLFKRNSFIYGNTWGNEIDSASNFTFVKNNSSLTWKNCTNITSFGQFIITDKNQVLSDVEINQNESTNTTIVSELYPNPSENWTTLEILSNIYQNAGISITDINGKLLSNFVQELSEGNNKILIKLPELTKGIYFVKIKLSKDSDIVRKLIIE
jgi:photosystem II stability/assembly factor-like uncharacterized protein